MRIFIATIVILAAGGLCYWVTRPQCEWHANDVFVAFEAGQLGQASERLSAVETTLCVGRARLSRVYLLQAEGRLQEAAHELARAKSWNERKGGPNITREIQLVGALQHLLEGDGELAAAQLHGEESLLRGIAAYMCEEWAHAAILLAGMPDPDRRWLRVAVDTHFPPMWRKEARAQSLLELGDYAAARATIGNPHHPLAAKSLLREARDLPLDAALPLYQQIGHIATRGVEDKLIEAALTRAGDPSPLRAEALSCLSNWLPAQGQLRLAQLLVASLSTEMLEELELEALCQAAAQEAERLIATGQFSQCTPFMALAATKAPVEVLEEQIVSLPLDQLEPALALWEGCQPDGSQRLRLSLRLLDTCSDRWGDAAAHQLINRAHEISSDLHKETFVAQLSLTIREAYGNALANNDGKALLLLLRTAQDFSIPGLPNLTPAQVANQVADINHLLELGRKEEASKRAKWLVAVQPGCVPAHATLGAMAYEKGSQEEALIHLRQLPKPTGQQLERLAICEILAGNPEHGEAILQSLIYGGQLLSAQSLQLLDHLALLANRE